MTRCDQGGQQHGQVKGRRFPATVFLFGEGGEAGLVVVGSLSCSFCLNGCNQNVCEAVSHVLICFVAFCQSVCLPACLPACLTLVDIVHLYALQF